MQSYVVFTFPQNFIPKKIKKTVRTVCGPFAANINWRKTTCNERCPAGLVVDMRIKRERPFRSAAPFTGLLTGCRLEHNFHTVEHVHSGGKTIHSVYSGREVEHSHDNAGEVVHFDFASAFG